VKFVVLPIKSFQTILKRIEDESDLHDIHEAKSEREGAVNCKVTRRKSANIFGINETSFS
jgi:hypothetical protein